MPIRAAARDLQGDCQERRTGARGIGQQRFEIGRRGFFQVEFARIDQRVESAPRDTAGLYRRLERPGDFMGDGLAGIDVERHVLEHAHRAVGRVDRLDGEAIGQDTPSPPRDCE